MNRKCLINAALICLAIFILLPILSSEVVDGSSLHEGSGFIQKSMPFASGASSKFKSSKEFLSHTNGSSTCSSQKCHSEFTDKRKFLHDPLVSGKCSECHSARAYPNEFGLDPVQRKTCARCHKKMEQEIQSSKSVHGPIKNGDCSSCHDPHQSVQPFLLRDSYNKLCLSCHKIASIYAGSFVHKPVKDGNCGLCHDPHASNFKTRLIDIGVNLCIVCHDTMLEGMTGDNLHEPIITSGCTDCHNPHSGNNKALLISPSSKLCFNCHKGKKNEVEQYTHKHEPAFKGQCTACHSPHYSDTKNLMLDDVDALCYNCHKKNRKWLGKSFKHGPVVQGNCTACHNPHGSDNPFILRLAFPHKFYSEYKEGQYSLCFLCHVKLLVEVDNTKTITNFRNGETNLHTFHVKQKKGRTCRACHNVHASNQEGRIRENFLFGKYEVRLEYSQTETGGSCLTGCHRELRYDRVNKVINDFRK